MNLFHRLSDAGNIVKELASPVWKSAVVHLRRGWLWLTFPRDPVDWKNAIAKAGAWLQLRTKALLVGLAAADHHPEPVRRFHQVGDDQRDQLRAAERTGKAQRQQRRVPTAAQGGRADIVSRVIAGVVFAALLYVIAERVGEPLSWFLKVSQADRDKIAPLLAPLASVVGTLATLAVGVFLARAALRQAQIATRVAEIAAQQAATAGQRHEEQTKSDFRRRIAESYSKAVTQLASDKIEERLGGIYTLESISKESPADYWTVMETLTAFVRESSRRNEVARTALDFDQRVSRRAYFLWWEAGRPEKGDKLFWDIAVKQEEIGEPPVTDIVAVLTVIKRRSERSREREGIEAWQLDLSDGVLKRSDFTGAQLGGVNFRKAHLERADLGKARLEGANLIRAHLEEADLSDAHLERASLGGAHLEGANLTGAHLSLDFSCVRSECTPKSRI